MDYYALSDKGIQAEIGDRIKSLRLRKNVTQQALCEVVQLSLNSIKSLEKGRGSLSTLIAVLRELGALEQLANFVPEVVVSPIALAKRQGQKRVRASGDRKKHGEDEKDENSW